MTIIKSPRSLRAALAAGALTLACAAPAAAAPTTPAAAPMVGQVAPNDEPVSYAIAVQDASGATVKTLDCDWVGFPGEDDRPCLAWAGDLGPAIDAIEAAGGVGSTWRVLAPAHAVDATTRLSPRADGTWLLRTTGANEDGPLHNGRVCDREGRHCVSWDVDGQAKASKAIQRAAKKLRAKR